MIYLLLILPIAGVLFVWAIIFLDMREIKRTNKRAEQAKAEFEAQINAVYEGAENWKREYDDCLLLLKLMTRFVENNTHTLTHKPSDLEITALNKAKKFLEKYQHYGY